MIANVVHHWEKMRDGVLKTIKNLKLLKTLGHCPTMNGQDSLTEYFFDVALGCT
jgi:hypothetical protein